MSAAHPVEELHTPEFLRKPWEQRLAVIRLKAARRCGLRSYPAEVIARAEQDKAAWPGRDIGPWRQIW